MSGDTSGMALDIFGVRKPGGEEPLAEDICPVCLDRISNNTPLSFTTCCNHTFHISCVSKLEGLQCPVCRYDRCS